MPLTVVTPASKPPATRLKLTMPSPTHAANLETSDASQNSEHQIRRPSYSPVTPTFPGAFSDVDANRGNQTDFIDEPEPIPISLEENSDAIALKAALSILQLQKQQALRDIKQLDKMKAAASKNPEAFLDALKAGELTKAPSKAVVDYDDDENDSGGGVLDENLADSEKSDYAFGKFPNPQNVVRCPPINWAKYHVVGDSLDKLHEEQRQRPATGSPRRDEYGRPPEHVVAAPYRPFVDKLVPISGGTRRERQE
jgi:hypothetical protein